MKATKAWSCMTTTTNAIVLIAVATTAPTSGTQNVRFRARSRQMDHQATRAKTTTLVIAAMAAAG